MIGSGWRLLSLRSPREPRLLFLLIGYSTVLHWLFHWSSSLFLPVFSSLFVPLFFFTVLFKCFFLHCFFHCSLLYFHSSSLLCHCLFHCSLLFLLCSSQFIPLFFLSVYSTVLPHCLLNCSSSLSIPLFLLIVLFPIKDVICTLAALVSIFDFTSKCETKAISLWCLRLAH